MTKPVTIDPRNAYRLDARAGLFVLARTDSPTSAPWSILESFEDEDLARQELATLNLKHAEAVAVELATEAVKAAGCGTDRMAEVMAVEAVGYVHPIADEFIFGAELDAVKAGGSACEALARAAVSWLAGCIEGGLDDAITEARNRDPRLS